MVLSHMLKILNEMKSDCIHLINNHSQNSIITFTNGKIGYNTID